MANLVRLQVWVTPAQKAKIRKTAKFYTKRTREPFTDSAIIRGLIDNIQI